MARFLSFLFLVLFLSYPLIAQVNLQPEDSTITIDAVYLGIYSENYFSLDSLNSQSGASFWGGAMASYRLTDYFSLTGSQVYGSSDKGETFGISRFFTKVKFASLTLETGLLISLATESRPSPLATGQFETWTESRIPGGGLGAKVKYHFQDSYLGLGVIDRKNLPEYHARFSSPHLKISVYYPQITKKLGASAKLEWPGISSVLVFSAGELVANNLTLEIDGARKISVYYDLGYDFQDKDLVRGEVGILKDFAVWQLKGLLGLGYCQEKNSLAGYLYIHL